jgi:hypothetical protein
VSSEKRHAGPQHAGLLLIKASGRFTVDGFFDLQGTLIRHGMAFDHSSILSTVSKKIRRTVTGFINLMHIDAYATGQYQSGILQFP